MSAVHPASETNVLLGLLALHNELISRPDLIAAVRQWVQSRKETLGKILIERGAIGGADLAALDDLLDRLLARHKGDVEQALAAIRCPRTVRVALEGVADDDLRTCLARLSTGPAGPESASATPSGPPGPSSQRFRIERLLFEGNLGSLYLAHDEELNRDVVIKQIHARFAGDSDAEGRFNREIKYASELEHSGIVPIYGAGSYSDGRRYYAMRYIKGEDLRAAVDRCHKLEGKDRLKQVRALVPRFAAVCRAIGFAHDRGVLHRDIKPENVMLSDDGETIVVDWGLAKPINSVASTAAPEGTLANRSAQDSSMLTKQFQAIGTVAYMSPETAGGELDRVGPWSDVFSLGATLYHLLTGKPAFSRSEAPSEPLLSKVQKCEFPRPRELWPDLPQALEAICVKAMARLPEQRYRSARALADDLERWMSDEGAGPRSGSWASGSAHGVLRHPWPVAAVGTVLLAVALAVGLDVLLHPAPADTDADVQAVNAELREKTDALAAVERERDALAAKVTTALADAEHARNLRHNADQSAAKSRLAADKAVRAAAEWMKKHALAATTIDGLREQVAQSTADVDKLSAQNKLAERKVGATAMLVKDAQVRFGKSYTAATDALDAIKNRLKKLDSKPLHWASLLAEAKLDRRFGDMYVLLNEHDKADTAYARAIAVLGGLEKSGATDAAKEEAMLELAVARHNRAWLLATSASVDKRNPKLAVTLARAAYDALPNDPFRLTYAIAFYRDKQYSQARDNLWQVKEPLSKNDNPDDYDTCLLFLAMADYQSNNLKEAAMWLREAQARLDQRTGKVHPELERFRDEAEQLLMQSRKSP